MRKFTREERPMGGRKDKEKREKALEDQRAVGNTLLIYCVLCLYFFLGFCVWCSKA